MQWRELFELMQSPPPFWVRAIEWVCMGIGALMLALTVMVQWVLWLVFTMQIWSPWTVILGIAICAAQMFKIFERLGGKKVSCEILK